MHLRRYSEECLNETYRQFAENPWKTDTMIARKVGATNKWVGDQRKNAGVPPSHVIRHEIIEEIVSENPDATANWILDELYDAYGIIVSDASVYRVRRSAC